jgi:hypothetical protein
MAPAIGVGYRANDLPSQGPHIKQGRQDAAEVVPPGNGASTASSATLRMAGFMSLTRHWQ